MKKKIGWGLTILIALMLVGPSAMGKFLQWEGKAEMLAQQGMSNELLMKIGILEVIIAILYVVPRISFLGTILLTGYLGGAIMTHLRIGESFLPPIVIGVLAWVALGLRQPIIFSLAFHPPSASQTGKG